VRNKPKLDSIYRFSLLAIVLGQLRIGLDQSSSNETTDVEEKAMDFILRLPNNLTSTDLMRLQILMKCYYPFLGYHS